MTIANLQTGRRIITSDVVEMDAFDSLSPEVRAILRDAWFPFSAFRLKQQGFASSPTAVNQIISRMQNDLSRQDNLMVRPND